MSWCGDCRLRIRCRSGGRHCLGEEVLPVSATEKASGAGASTGRKAAAIGNSSSESDAESLSEVPRLRAVSPEMAFSMASALGSLGMLGEAALL
jgi:hypothetical protein